MIPLKEPIIDPRIKRLDVESTFGSTQLNEHEGWFSWEVFHQEKRGEQHVHVGIVHAPDAQLALVFAKEQYGRRLKCVNLWVVKSADVYAFSYDDQDMFETAPEKMYREAGGYKVRDKINEYKKEHNATGGSH